MDPSMVVGNIELLDGHNGKVPPLPPLPPLPPQNAVVVESFFGAVCAYTIIKTG